MNGRAPLLVIQNDPTCPIGWFGDRFAAAGLPVAVRRAYADDGDLDDAGDVSGVVVLGGEMGANDDASLPWLGPVKSLIRSVIHADIPFLGICLGHQLAAAALGGAVAPNPAGRAIGLTPVTLTAAGRSDPLLGDTAPGSQAIQWNSDVVTAMPAGSELLAVCPDGTPQAIRFAAHAWGVQFHPEASPEIFASWLPAGRREDDETEELLAYRAIAAAGDDLRRAWRGLADRFARYCSPAPG